MAKLKKNDLKKMTKIDLEKHLVELKKDLMGLRAKASTGAAVESPGRIGAVRRNIARVITFINLKEEVVKSE